jgi:hypothetical protein
MLETQKVLDEISETRLNLKKQGNYAEADDLLKAEAKMTSAILNYHGLIAKYVKSENALIDDFDEEFEEFLENNIYNLDVYYEYGYSDEAIEEIKKAMRKEFMIEMWTSVIDDNFNSSDETIQTFINGFSKIDLYLYIISKS